MEVAKLDDVGVIQSVDPVSEKDWITDHKKKQVQLPLGHDMRDRLGTMWWDWNLGTFKHITDMPDDENTGDTNDLIGSILVKTAEKLHEKGDIILTDQEKRVIARIKSVAAIKARK